MSATMCKNGGNVIVEVFDDRYKKQVDYVSNHLRAEDFDEVFAVTGECPRKDVITCWSMSSRRWMIFDKNASGVAVLGVMPLTPYSRIGIPWLLGTYGLETMKRFFISISKGIIEEMKVGYDYLINFVDARYVTSVRWLSWCGFDMEEATPYGELNMEFHRFIMRCK